ncbi:hypothetical protein FOL47_004445 [Perkinsus chesapeaki]|uniref:Uncharacterized protein n=1 Tax=Perkinsus chesapeaki TaxID=330153 RepID=A0A7J6M2S0_PERCH|nr:hypothetical protein FOL47_004445 [Perkinsus chesapeaki]
MSVFEGYEIDCRRQIMEAQDRGDQRMLEEARRTLGRLDQQARLGSKREAKMEAVAELKGLIGEVHMKEERTKAETERRSDSTRRLEDIGRASTATLNQAVLNAIETERTALEITSELGRQRDMLVRTSGNAGRVGEELAEARGSVRRMEQKKKQCLVMIGLMDHAWAYSLPDKSKRGSPSKQAPVALTPEEGKARGRRKRFYVGLITIIDRWERTCSGGCLKQVRKMAELKRQSWGISEAGRKKGFSPCWSYQIRSVASRNTEDVAKQASVELARALSDLEGTIEDLHHLWADYEQDCPGRHFATNLERAYREELSFREDLVEAMALLEYPDDFNGLQRILIVFTELSAAGYSLVQGCCGIPELQGCVDDDAEGGSTDLPGRFKDRELWVEFCLGYRWCQLQPKMRYKVNATDIIIATIVGGGSMLYTCYPILRRLEDHDKAILEARKRRSERKEAEAAAALRAAEGIEMEEDEESYPRPSIYDPLGPPIEQPSASSVSSTRWWGRLKFW